MKSIDFDYFLHIFEKGESVDETYFYFADDVSEQEHYLGFLPEYEKPYWVGYCDIPDGTEFLTAKEMMEAKIYDGQSIKERWDMVRIVAIGQIDVETWLQMHHDE